MIPSFFRLNHVARTQSTNTDAQDAAKRGEAEGLVIYADTQDAGRGRQGRKWDSPEGNLYVSVLLRPQNLTPREAGAYSFVAALAVHDAVAAFLPEAQIQIKWPNDVLVNGKKISGILVETAPVLHGKTEWLVIGAGVNVRHHPHLSAETGAYPTTSLAESGSDITVPQLLEAYLVALQTWLEILRDNGFTAIRTAWHERARRGKITARVGGETVEGDFLRLDDSGHLILRLADGAERSISAGDVFFQN